MLEMTYEIVTGRNQPEDGGIAKPPPAFGDAR